MNAGFGDGNNPGSMFRDPATDGRVSNRDRPARRHTVRRSVPRKSVSSAPWASRPHKGLLPVGMATSHCSVGVAVDAVLVMVAEVTASRPYALSLSLSYFVDIENNLDNNY